MELLREYREIAISLLKILLPFPTYDRHQGERHATAAKLSELDKEYIIHVSVSPINCIELGVGCHLSYESTRILQVYKPLIDFLAYFDEIWNKDLPLDRPYALRQLFREIE